MSRGRGHARERLTHLGERTVDGPSPRFASGLERRLVQGASLAAGATLVALPTRHRSLTPFVTLGAGALATVVLAGALFGTFGRGGSDVLSLAAAVDTTVVMPGGHTVAGRTGLQLPNGSVVWTGPNGSAVGRDGRDRPRHRGGRRRRPAAPEPARHPGQPDRRHPRLGPRRDADHAGCRVVAGEPAGVAAQGPGAAGRPTGRAGHHPARHHHDDRPPGAAPDHPAASLTAARRAARHQVRRTRTGR